MISFEEYLEGLRELEEKYKQEVASAQRTSLVLDRIIENAQQEKKQLSKEVDKAKEKIEEYKKRSTEEYGFSVSVKDLRLALAKAYSVKLKDVSAEMYLRRKYKIGYPDKLQGHIHIDVTYEDFMYDPHKITNTYWLEINSNTRFTDGTKLDDNVLNMSVIDLNGVKYNLAKDRNLDDLQVDINLSNGYMNDIYFRKALEICSKAQQKKASVTK